MTAVGPAFHIHMWMRCSRVVTGNAKVTTVLGSITASSDTEESEERQMKQ